MGRWFNRYLNNLIGWGEMLSTAYTNWLSRRNIFLSLKHLLLLTKDSYPARIKLLKCCPKMDLHILSKYFVFSIHTLTKMEWFFENNFFFNNSMWFRTTFWKINVHHNEILVWQFTPYYDFQSLSSLREIFMKFYQIVDDWTCNTHAQKL